MDDFTLYLLSGVLGNQIAEQVIKHNLMGRCLEFEEQGVKIRVEMGSAWHFCGMACRISIDGKYYAGNRIVWFAKKAGNES